MFLCDTDTYLHDYMASQKRVIFTVITVTTSNLINYTDYHCLHCVTGDQYALHAIINYSN
jgi:hypothetical protein